jgi:hypothetical protein
MYCVVSNSSKVYNNIKTYHCVYVVHLEAYLKNTENFLELYKILAVTGLLDGCENWTLNKRPQRKIDN